MPETQASEATTAIATKRRNKSPESPASMFERLAKDPNVDVDKLERLMSMYERAEAKRAETEFAGALGRAQEKIKPVLADDYNENTNSKYPSYEKLDAAIRPHYTAEGLSLSFNSGAGAPENHVRVICLVRHCGGHKEPYFIDMPADGKGPKGGDVMTKTHATGSAFTYGQRYLLKAIFNVAVKKDDDGNQAGGSKSEDIAPPGYDDWLDRLQAAALDKGMPAFAPIWNEKQAGNFRKYLARTAPQMLENIKTKAREVSGGR